MTQAHTWRCTHCDATGKIKHQSWMNGTEPAKWGLEVLDDVMREHDRQSPQCRKADVKMFTETQEK
jgi:hypothetical protein